MRIAGTRGIPAGPLARLQSAWPTEPATSGEGHPGWHTAQGPQTHEVCGMGHLRLPPEVKW
ncbi:hypothetical protein CONPUDRAFT_160759 [Coniophora puteana RWD-64-598 SS2]|uniref:Uncharacterized protein n=1 Tax=Coniophora puteana (strain RWD-64-598) TaxID=741705 RepID=R7SF98_CONPW|nr:uncharacterized protein CONPUDRAFT_160759 [Coniophora puteana RWD-64-598 SS2]EIW73749.1 hypothetical protein CONPUDRAFT_160759 [Coniophora puteana RWD-64-598 SS2]